MSIDWEKAVKKVSPYVLIITEYKGDNKFGKYGTGFKISTKSPDFYFIVTANHILPKEEHLTGAALKLFTSSLSNQLFLPPNEDQLWRIHRCIPLDIAILMITRKNGFDYPGNGLKLLPPDSSLNVGRKVGWVGFPETPKNVLCFFSGRISAVTCRPDTWWIDGNVIKGVSGGPVFHVNETEDAEVIGVASYGSLFDTINQRKELVTLPGLFVAHNIYGAHQILQNINSLEEFSQKKQEIENALVKPPSIPSSTVFGNATTHTTQPPSPKETA